MMKGRMNITLYHEQQLISLKVAPLVQLVGACVDAFISCSFGALPVPRDKSDQACGHEE
jgi:hypothetical protein